MTGHTYGPWRGLWHAGLGPAVYACGITGALLQLTGRWHARTPPELAVALGATLIGALGMMVLDRVKWRDADLDPADEAADPRRVAFLRPHTRGWRGVAAACALAGAAGAWLSGGPVAGAGVALGYAAIGLYAGRPPGKSLSVLRLKDIPVVKNLFVALGLVGLSAVIALGRELAAITSPEVSGVITVLLVVVACDAALCDVPDIDSDRRFGARTLPVLAGARAGALGALGAMGLGCAWLWLGATPGLTGVSRMWAVLLWLSAALAAFAPRRALKTAIDLRPIVLTLAGALLTQGGARG